MGIRERRVETYLTEQIEENEGGTWKLTGVRGMPDRLCILPKHSIFMVEVKTTDGRLSESQIRLHVRMSRLGGKVYTVYGKSGVDALIAELC